jgi:hypothetical protein
MSFGSTIKRGGPEAKHAGREICENGMTFPARGVEAARGMTAIEAEREPGYLTTWPRISPALFASV